MTVNLCVFVFLFLFFLIQRPSIVVKVDKIGREHIEYQKIFLLSLLLSIIVASSFYVYIGATEDVSEPVRIVYTEKPEIALARPPSVDSLADEYEI